MRRISCFLGAVSAVAVVVVLWPALAQAAECNVTDVASGGYSVEICVQVGSGDTVLTDDTPVSVTATVAGDDPGIRQMRFYLSGEYILTDFDEPYRFTLPPGQWVDGTYLLEAEALMRDDETTGRTAVSIELSTGTLVPPLNGNRFTPATGTKPLEDEQFVVAATGDGPDGGVDTQAVVSLIQNQGANLLLYLGDVYEDGTKTEFYNWYGSDGARWDALRPITNPTVGNHEIVDGVSTGYDDYWDNIPRYYSFDANGWHFVSLDSERLRQGDPEQLTWLRRDLGTSTEACTVVYLHHPVLSIGPQGDSPRLSGVWAELVDAGVDAVIAAHEHTYQRWTPLDASLSPDPDGVPLFVAGAAGHGMQEFVRSDPRFVVGADEAPLGYGALFLSLNTAGAEFRYMNIEGDVLDTGVISCSGAGVDDEPPSPPSDLEVVPESADDVALSWTGSRDNVGVAGYAVYRDGSVVGTVGTGVTSFVDSTVDADTTYTYTIDAFDPAGNHSEAAAADPVSTPPAVLTVTVTASADAYVAEDDPNANFGSRALLRVDRSPLTRAFLRFDVPPIETSVVAAALRIRVDTDLAAGFEVHELVGSNWDESTLTFATAPEPGRIVGASGPVTSGKDVEIDVSSYVEGAGSIDFVIVPLSDTNLRLSSRESDNPPLLIVTEAPPPPRAAAVPEDGPVDLGEGLSLASLRWFLILVGSLALFGAGFVSGKLVSRGVGRSTATLRDKI